MKEDNRKGDLLNFQIIFVLS